MKKSKLKPSDRASSILTSPKKWLYLLPLLSYLFTSTPVQAEGSKDLVANGGDRPWLETFNGAYTATFLRNTVIDVSVQPGEWINMGSSAIGYGSGDIVYTPPSGGSISCNLTQPGKGAIANPTEEQNGPGTGTTGATGVFGTGGSYQPCLVQVGAGQGGIWQVRFVPPAPNTNQGSFVLPTGGLSTTAQWDQSTYNNLTAAWDVTVRTDPGNTQTQTGRVYTDLLALNLGDQSAYLNSSLYVLTTDGFIYKTTLNQMQPYGFVFLANNKGILYPNGQPSYHSATSPGATINGTSPVSLSAGMVVQNPVHKVFFNPPDPALDTLPTPINTTAINPQVTNASFTGLIKNTTPVGAGGTFKYTSNVNGSSQIAILDSNNNIVRVISSQSSVGTNSFTWDGTDNNGVALPVGQYSFQITVRSGEYHFPMLDVEDNINGLTFDLLNPPGPFTPGTDATTAYYDDNNIPTPGDYYYDNKPAGVAYTMSVGNNPPAPNPLYTNPIYGTGTNSGNYHAFGDDGDSNGWGNNQALDTWIYFTGQPTIGNLIIFANQPNVTATKSVVDLNGNNPAAPGDTLRYTITMTNSGTRATGVFFNDFPDPNTTIVIGSVTATGGGVVLSGNNTGDTSIRVNMANLEAGDIKTVTYDVKINNPLPATVKQVGNQGSVTGSNIPTILTSNPSQTNSSPPAPTITPVSPSTSGTPTSATVTATKTAALVVDVNGNGVVASGDTLLYTITLVNNSSIAATGVVYADTPDGNTTLVSGSVTAPTGSSITSGNTPGNKTVNVNIGSIPVSGSVTITYKVTVNNPLPSGTTQLVNQGSVSGTNLPTTLTDDPSKPGAQDPTVVPLGANTPAPGAVSAIKTAALVQDINNNGIPVSGDVVEYTIAVTSISTANNVILVDPLPPNTTYVPGSLSIDGVAKTDTTNDDQAEIVGSTIVFRLGTGANSSNGGTLNTGTTTTAKFRVKLNPGIAAGTTINNQGTVTGSNFPPTLTDYPLLPGPTDPTPIVIGTPMTSTGVNADLSISKTANNLNPSVGSQVTYTLQVNNNGPNDATGVNVVDQIPSGLTFISATASQGIYNPSTGQWTIGNLANGGKVTLQITATVNSLPVTNNATVSATTTDNNPQNNQTSLTIPQTTTTQPPVDLGITEIVDNPVPTPGQQVTYTLQVTNNSPNNATGVKVTDLLPPGVQLVSFIPSIGTYNPVTGIWTIGNLPSGAVATLKITVIVNSTNTPIVNTAVVQGDQPDPYPANNQVSLTIPLSPTDLGITKTIDNTTATVGQQITYTLRVTNNGPNDATGTSVSDPLPSGLSFVSATPSVGTYNPTTGIWSIGNLANGAIATLQITATVTSIPFTNRALVTANQPDPNPGNNQATVTVPLSPADLRVIKTVNNSAVGVGQQAVYTIQVTNNGPNDATGVNVVDQLPSGLTFVGATASVGTYNPTTGIWSIGNLSYGALATLQVTANVTAVPQTNVAIVKADQPDPNPYNNESRVTVPSGDADLKITKSVNNFSPTAGQQVTYTITLGNNGPNNATGVQVLEQIPTGESFVKATPSQGTYNSTTGQWNVGSLANGGTATLQITVTVNSIPVTNTAVITHSDQNDPNPANNEDTLTLPTQVAALSVTKTVDNANVGVGGNVTYTVKVTNNGPDTATGVLLRDLIPTQLTFLSATASQGTYNPTTGVWNIGTIANQQAATLQLTTRVISVPAVNYAQVIAANQYDPNSRPNNNDFSEPDKSSISIPNSGGSGFRLVKRITAITQQGVTTNFTDFVKDPQDNNDNVSGWTGHLPVGIYSLNNTTALRSGDQLEYTIYFLADGSAPVQKVSFCDLIPTNTTFVPNTFSASSGIQLNQAGTVTLLTNAQDGDGGTFFSPLAPLPSGTSCGNSSNSNGAVVVNINNVSNSSGQNFGFVRFRVSVN